MVGLWNLLPGRRHRSGSLHAQGAYTLREPTRSGSLHAQGAYSAALLRWPRRALALLGIAGNLSIVVLYLVIRTVDIPFFGPETGEVEAKGATGLCATTSELTLVGALEAMLLQDLSPQRRRLVLLVVAIAILSVGHLLHLLLRGSPT